MNAAYELLKDGNKKVDGRDTPFFVVESFQQPIIAVGLSSSDEEEGEQQPEPEPETMVCNVCGLAEDDKHPLVRCRSKKGGKTCGKWVHGGFTERARIRCSVGITTTECITCQGGYENSNFKLQPPKKKPRLRK